MPSAQVLATGSTRGAYFGMVAPTGLTREERRSMKVIQPKLKLQTKLLYILPVLAVVIMLFLATGVYLKTAVSPTHAEADRITGSSGATITAAADRDLTVTIHNSEIVLDLTPSQQGVFRYNDFATNPLTVEVATNNPTGYNLNMTATTTDLIRTAPLSGQTPVIHTLSSGSFTSDTFETNAWGFTMDGTTYQPVTLSRQINQTTKESNSSTTSLAFGVKLNDEIPSGNYKATLTFIATTNPLEASFDTAFDAAGKTQVNYNGQNYYKMQDMSGFICSMVATPTDTTSAESTQLIDTRDNSVYWVSKLLDGNCWMTQNLDLDLDSSVTLTSANTDLHSVTSWTPVNSTVTTSSSAIQTCDSQSSCWGGYNQNFATSWTQSDDVPSSANPGYRYMIPKFLDEPNPTGQWYANGDTFANCSTQDANCGGQGHYMIGNYYNFAAANATNSVAGTVGHTVTNSDADFVMSNSICPKGWRMPLGQSSNNDFTTLMTAYNIVGTNAMAFNFQGLNAVRKASLYFVRSGYVNGGTLYYAGTGSYVWSSTIGAEANGRYLSFYSTGINPANSDSRLSGFAVRCLARTDLTIEDATYLQDITPEMRQNTAIGTTATLKDKRDNNEYTIGKLADGQVWLLDNLRLDLGTVSLDTLIGNTNASATTLGYLKNGGGTSPYTATGVTVKTSDSGSWINSYDAPYIVTSGTSDLGDWTSETVVTHSGAGSGMIGVYYNYCAASAGSYCYPSSTSSGNATEDICPANWHLPTGGTSGEYRALCDKAADSTCNGMTASSNPSDINAANSLQALLSTPLSGVFYSYSAHGQNSEGIFWSSTWDNIEGMHRLQVDATSIRPQGSNYRYNGFSVRCILK